VVFFGGSSGASGFSGAFTGQVLPIRTGSVRFDYLDISIHLSCAIDRHLLHGKQFLLVDTS